MVVMMSVRLYMISRPLKVIWALTPIVKGTLQEKIWCVAQFRGYLQPYLVPESLWNHLLTWSVTVWILIVHIINLHQSFSFKTYLPIIAAS